MKQSLVLVLEKVEDTTMTLEAWIELLVIGSLDGKNADVVGVG